jgi:hypothetical protein
LDFVGALLAPFTLRAFEGCADGLETDFPPSVGLVSLPLVAAPFRALAFAVAFFGVDASVIDLFVAFFLLPVGVFFEATGLSLGTSLRCVTLVFVTLVFVPLVFVTLVFLGAATPVLLEAVFLGAAFGAAFFDALPDWLAVRAGALLAFFFGPGCVALGLFAAEVFPLGLLTLELELFPLYALVAVRFEGVAGFVDLADALGAFALLAVFFTEPFRLALAFLFFTLIPRVAFHVTFISAHLSINRVIPP